MTHVRVKVVDIGYQPRPQFVDFHRRKQRWAVMVAHRRAGKTVACIADVVDEAIAFNALPNGRFGYVAPYFNQAKEIAWSYLKDMALRVPGTQKNESELYVEFAHNKARVRLYGADNYDRMRGTYFDGLVIDEYGDMDPRAWSEVMRPALADRQGRATFIGTPKGDNDFHKKWLQARDNPDDWYCSMLKASQTGLLSQRELDDMRAELTPDEYEREMECSFEAAVPGAIYARWVRQAEEDGRIGAAPWDSRLLVTTSWDLGWNDATAIWFAQHRGREIHLIDYYEARQQDLAHYVKVLREKPYAYYEHVLPHDAKAHDVSTNLSRVDILHDLGLYKERQRVLRQSPITERISAARAMFPMMIFDARRCERGLQALRDYRRKEDLVNKTLSSTPLHDWASNGADSFGYLCQGIRPVFDPSQLPGDADRGQVFS